MARSKLLVLALVALLCPIVAAEDFIIVCPIEGMIDDGNNVFVKRVVEEAEGADAIIFVIDTFGGRVDSAIEITESITKAPCHTVAYIKGKGAISAGALISFACDDLLMAPDTNIGAASPVYQTTEGIIPAGEKEVSFLRAKMRALAEHKGHNPDIAQAMVDKDIELRLRYEDGEPVAYATKGIRTNSYSDTSEIKDIIVTIIDALEGKTGERDSQEAEPEPEPRADDDALPSEGELIVASGKLLTMSANEALKYGVIKAKAGTMESVRMEFNYDYHEVREVAMTWSEILFRWLTNPIVSGLLLMMGIGGIYMEFKTPGFGAFGITGVVCLCLFFGSHFVIGLADWIDILLVAAGLGLIAAEIFVVPGFGITGVSGIICLFLGLYLSLTNVAIPQFEWQFDRLRDAAISLSIAGISFMAFVYAMWKLFPHTPMYRWFILSRTQLTTEGFVVQTLEETESAVGLKGTARTVLRPAGKGRFGSKTYDIVTQGDFIPKGTPVIIVEAVGNRYVVETIKEDE